MNQDLGFLHAFLLKNRIVETRPTSRKTSAEEKRAAAVIRSLDPMSFEQFANFLSGQGFELVHRDSNDVPGVHAQNDVWLLLRNGRDPVPEWISVEPAIEAVKIGNDTNTEAATWFVHIYLHYLAIIYSSRQRGVSEVSGYQGSEFRTEDLLETVRRHIETLRRMSSSDEATNSVVKTLISERGTDVERRVKRFLSVMVASGLLIEMEEDAYQQSLLGAVEIAENYQRSLGAIVPKEDVLAGLVNYVNPVTGIGE